LLNALQAKTDVNQQILMSILKLSMGTKLSNPTFTSYRSQNVKASVTRNSFAMHTNILNLYIVEKYSTRRIQRYHAQV